MESGTVSNRCPSFPVLNPLDSSHRRCLAAISVLSGVFLMAYGGATLSDSYCEPDAIKYTTIISGVLCLVSPVMVCSRAILQKGKCFSAENQGSVQRLCNRCLLALVGETSNKTVQAALALLGSLFLSFGIGTAIIDGCSPEFVGSVTVIAGALCAMVPVIACMKYMCTKSRDESQSALLNAKTVQEV